MARIAQDDMDFESAKEIAERAMLHMLRENVPATPNNFTVWFNYCLGTPPDLKRTIDILVGNKRKFDSFVCDDLRTMYMATPGVHAPAAQNISEQLSQVMAQAQQYLATAITDNRDHIREIDGVATRADQGIDPRALIEALMAALASAASRASILETNFTEASQELDTIRGSLRDAEERAKTDTLTSLPNRRALEEFFRAAQMRAMEVEDPLSLLMLDIDHFKKFNDTYGHNVGDQVIRLIASVLRERVRENDLPARYGGEELIAVLPGADLATCRAVAERIRETVAGCHLTRRSTGESLPDISVSVGVAQFRPGESMASLIERCDRALYKAKASGRNCVITEDDLTDADCAA
ncbi:putative diguanylate cyclase [Afipia carboxidovorans OM5]|nr:putative diguanylate cyclase [Afipia carboxidovorans OM5]